MEAEILEKRKKIESRTIDNKLFKDYIKSKFSALLGQLHGDHFFIRDEESSIAINIVLGAQFLQENGLKIIKHLDMVEQVPKDFKQILFFTTPNLKSIKKIEKIIKQTQKLDSRENQRNYNLIFYPKRTTLSLETLENLGILGTFNEIIDFNFDLIPLEYDLMSLEMEKTYKELVFQGDLRIYQQVAESIQRLQSVYGQIPNIFVKGNAGKKVLDILKLNESLQQTQDINIQQPEVEQLIIIDREIDMITPFIRQRTYEGLIDDIFGITGIYVDLPGEVQGNDFNKVDKIKLQGGDTNLVYEKIRSLIMPQGVAQQIQNEQKEHDDTLKYYDQIKNQKPLQTEQLEMLTKRIKIQNEYKTILKMHSQIFNSIQEKISSLKSVRDGNFETKIICEEDLEPKEIYEYIENLICIGEPLKRVLKFICLYSLVTGGWKEKFYEEIRKDLIQAYGLSSIVLMNNLSKMGLFKKLDVKYKWKDVLEKFGLIDEKVDLKGPYNVSYSYCGYVPISIKYVSEAVTNKSWNSFQKINSLINGYFDFPQQYRPLDTPKRTIIVYFIGGITYGEITSIRILAETLGVEILIATTHIINYNRLLKFCQNDTDLIDMSRM